MEEDFNEEKIIEESNNGESIEELLTQDDVVYDKPKKKNKKKEAKKKAKEEKKLLKEQKREEKRAKKNKNDDEEKPVKPKKKINKKTLIILGSVLLALVLAIVIFYFVFVPKISLEGKSKMEIEYGNKYKEPGYKATYLGKDITDKVWIKGKVNENKLGTYTLEYKVQKNKIVVTKKRSVTIKDTKKPELTLTGDLEKKICPNKEYEEEGFKAEDNYDGDITESVKTSVKPDSVTYVVKDSSGNKTTVVRKLIREDAEGPKIELKGGSTVYVIVNGKYTEQGYTATDNCDGDLSSKVTVSGEVKTGTTGTYTLTYKVTDSANNTTEVKRNVVVQQNYSKVPANTTCGKAGVIYLTFDDGPSTYWTADILDILKKYDVKATFFVTGRESDALIKREYDEGHAVAIHTWTHDYGTIYKSSDAFWNDMQKVQDRIKRVTGHETRLMRFPGGASNTVSRKYNSGIMTRLANEAIGKGFNYVDWNISSGDAGGTTDPKVEAQNVIRELSKSRGNVVLMHDIHKHTRYAIEEMIQYGKNNGYTFAVIDENVICRHKINN